MAEKDKIKNKKALCIGANGQDGSYLCEILLEKGYEVHGTIRRHSNINSTERIDHIFDKLKLHYADVTDALNISKLISEIKPDIIFNMAAQSHVKVSFEMPNYTGQVDAIGVLNILEAIRVYSPDSVLVQASTSEMYGGLNYNRPKEGYNEESSFHPRSPYGVSKVYGYWMVRNYRESYGLKVNNTICFNHESPRRGETFVTKKITKAFAKIKNGKQEVLSLGNLDSLRDWGYAKEYCEFMVLLAESGGSDDYVMATNETHTIREFVEEAAKICNWEIEWNGVGVDEKGFDKKTGKLLIEIDSKYFRPAEVDLLLGDASKAKEKFGWEPKVKFKELVKLMMEYDLVNN